MGNNKLYADELHKAVTYMHENKMYKEMTMYVEACESGSMFEKILEDNINVYAVSAANSHESSWGTYCSPHDKVDGKHIGSCLGDLFSVNWMQDTEGTLGGTQGQSGRRLLGGGGGGCEGDYGSKVGDPVCCGQPGTIDKASEICPASSPK